MNSENPTRKELSTIRKYLTQIGELDLMTWEEEKHYAWKLINDGDPNAANEFWSRNLRLVVSLSKGYRGKGLEFEDLISEGNLGLRRAIETYDPATGNRFSTYASWWIKQHMGRAIADKNMGRPLRLPIYMRDLIKKISPALRAAEKSGNSINARSLSKRFGVGEGTIERAMDYYYFKRGVPITNSRDSGDGGVREGSLGFTGKDAFEDISSKETYEFLDSLIDNFTKSKKQAEIIRARYGFSSRNGQSNKTGDRTLEDIGEEFNLTKERVRQICNEFLEKVAEAAEKDPEIESLRPQD